MGIETLSNKLETCLQSISSVKKLYSIVSCPPQGKQHLILYLTVLECRQVCLFEWRDIHCHWLLAFFLILQNALIQLPNTHMKLNFVFQTIVWVVSVTENVDEKEYINVKVTKHVLLVLFLHTTVISLEGKITVCI